MILKIMASFFPVFLQVLEGILSGRTGQNSNRLYVIPLSHYRWYHPQETCLWSNVPVLDSPSVVCMKPCESVAHRPLPCKSYQSFKIFEISASDFRTVSMHRQFCMYDGVTDDVFFHNVHKVMIHSSFRDTQLHKVS